MEVLVDGWRCWCLRGGGGGWVEVVISLDGGLMGGVGTKLSSFRLVQKVEGGVW